MAKFVPDVKTQRWIVISQTRTSRPDEHGLKKEEEKPSVCVFCSGNEAMTPPEIMRIGEGEKDKPGWKIRVIPNKFPITDTHEVIIHSPDHNKDIAEFDLNQVNQLLTVYRQRFQIHAGSGQVISRARGAPAWARSAAMARLVRALLAANSGTPATLPADGPEGLRPDMIRHGLLRTSTFRSIG